MTDHSVPIDCRSGGRRKCVVRFSPPRRLLVASFERLTGTQSNQRIQLGFGNGTTSSAAAVDSVLFAGSGNYNVTLTTTISDQVLSQVSLSTTAGGGWDDGWSPSPDPWLVISTPAAATCILKARDNIPTPGLASTSFCPIRRTRSPSDEDLFLEDDYLGAMTFTPAGPGTMDINADPSYGSLTILLQTAVSTTDTSQVVVNGSAVDIEEHNRGHTLWPWVRPHRLHRFWEDSWWAPGGFGVCSEENGWYHVLAASATGCTGASHSLSMFTGCLIPLGLSLVNSLKWWAPF